MFKNIRRAIPSDGLLSDEELYEMFKVGNIRSLYEEGIKSLGPNASVPSFGERLEVDVGRKGRYEPKFTSFTHFWRLTLGTASVSLSDSRRLIYRTSDYIFVLDGEGSSPDDRPNVTQLLKPHAEEIMEPGLPRKGMLRISWLFKRLLTYHLIFVGLCGSDHVALAVEIEL